MIPTKTTPTLRCTCPRGMYSPSCPIEQHRSIANDINILFVGTGRRRRPRGVNKGSYRRRDWKASATFWLANLWDSGKIERWIIIFILGFLLLAVGSQIYQRVTDKQSLSQIIQSQTAGAK